MTTFLVKTASWQVWGQCVGRSLRFSVPLSVLLGLGLSDRALAYRAPLPTVAALAPSPEHPTQAELAPPPAPKPAAPPNTVQASGTAPAPVAAQGSPPPVTTPGPQSTTPAPLTHSPLPMPQAPVKLSQQPDERYSAADLGPVSQLPNVWPDIDPDNPPDTSDNQDAEPPLPLDPNCDPELGCLRLQDVPLQRPRSRSVYLIGRLDFLNSSNILSGVDPLDGGLLRSGLTLYAVPRLGPQTFLTAAIDGNLVRYFQQPEVSYNELRLRAGILQQLSPTMFGEIGWDNQQLFLASSEIRGLTAGTRFLNDHAVRLQLRRQDQLARNLQLDTFYQLRVGFADPDTRSRILNTLYASLNYEIRPNLKIGLDYQFSLAHFTQQKREDQFHQILARVTYRAFRSARLSLFVGYSFGGSTEPNIDFDGFIVGANLSIPIGLF